MACDPSFPQKGFNLSNNILKFYSVGAQVSHLGAAVAEMRSGSVLGVARFVQVNDKISAIKLTKNNNKCKIKWQNSVYCTEYYPLS